MDTNVSSGLAKTACKRCRERRKKCDLKTPICTRCVGAKSTCVYPQVIPKRGRPPNKRQRTNSSTSTNTTSISPTGWNYLQPTDTSNTETTPNDSQNPDLQQQNSQNLSSPAGNYLNEFFNNGYDYFNQGYLSPIGTHNSPLLSNTSTEELFENDNNLNSNSPAEGVSYSPRSDPTSNPTYISQSSQSPQYLQLFQPAQSSQPSQPSQSSQSPQSSQSSQSPQTPPAQPSQQGQTSQSSQSSQPSADSSPTSYNVQQNPFHTCVNCYKTAPMRWRDCPLCNFPIFTSRYKCPNHRLFYKIYCAECSKFFQRQCK